jgi:hypothetical protein
VRKARGAAAFIVGAVGHAGDHGRGDRANRGVGIGEEMAR